MDPSTSRRQVSPPPNPPTPLLKEDKNLAWQEGHFKHTMYSISSWQHRVQTFLSSGNLSPTNPDLCPSDSSRNLGSDQMLLK